MYRALNSVHRLTVCANCTKMKLASPKRGLILTEMLCCGLNRHCISKEVISVDFMTFLKKALAIIAAIAMVIVVLAIIDAATYDTVYDATLRMRLH